MPTNQTAGQVFDACFLEVRAKLLEIAACLDRIDRAESSNGIGDDPRMRQIRTSIDILKSPRPSRTEQIQLAFSDEYEPDWDE